MKLAFTLLFFCLFFLAETALAHYYSGAVTSKQLLIVEASLDSKVMYVVITASLLGVIKLKKNPG